jgi:hypothetical protein
MRDPWPPITPAQALRAIASQYLERRLGPRLAEHNLDLSTAWRVIDPLDKLQEHRAQ